MSNLLFFIIIAILFVIAYGYDRYTVEGFASKSEKNTEINKWFSENPKSGYNQFKEDLKDVNIVDYETNKS